MRIIRTVCTRYGALYPYNKAKIQINIPKFYSAEVTVDYSGFIEPHLFSVSDTYGGIIRFHSLHFLAQFIVQ